MSDRRRLGRRSRHETTCGGRGGRLRVALLCALPVVLVACTTGDILLDEPDAGYVQDLSTPVMAVDWSRAETVTVELTEFRFTPADLAFRRGAAYRLVLRNAGKTTHRFVSDGFFKSVAARELASAEGVIASPYLKVIEVAPGEVKELSFVPIRKGAFDLECSVFLHEAFGMEGRIIIE